MQLVTSAQFSHSVVSDSLRYMDCSMPGFPVHHQLLELAQTHVQGVRDKLEPRYIYHPQISGPLRIALCLCSREAAAQPGRQHARSQHGSLSTSSPRLRPAARKRVLSRCFYSLTGHLVTMEPCRRRTTRLIVLTPVGTTSLLLPKRQGHFDFQVLRFKKHTS